MPCWRRRDVSTADTTTRASARELRDICGAEYVVEDPAAAGASQILGVTPAMRHRRRSADEIAAILRFANQHS